MRIAVNTRLLLPGRLEGIGWFTHEVLRRLVASRPQDEFLFLFDRPYDAAFLFGDNVSGKVLFPQARHPLLWYWWFEHAVTGALRQWKADVFFSPEAYLSIKSKVPTVMTVHDLSILHHPEHVPSLVQRYTNHFYPRFIARADRLLTVSEYSRQDIVRFYPNAVDKLSVVGNGAREEYYPLSGDDIQSIREKWTGGQPYFIYVGALQPRKNIARLLQAFDEYRQQGGQLPLLLIGRKAWMTAEIEEAYRRMNHAEHVQLLDYQPLHIVAQLVGAAHAMVYVSLFEGFGIPLLEAMQSGVPVITSNVTSMPEVAGNAGLLVDPFDTASITHALLKMEGAGELYRQLQSAALVQAAAFTWDSVAQKVSHVINDCVTNP